MKEDVLKFIKKIRSYGSGIQPLFTMGYCYYFACMLKTRFPEAKIFFNLRENHVITKIGANYYDINGLVEDKSFLGALIEESAVKPNIKSQFLH